MTKKGSVEEIRAAAEAAISARQIATDARAAADAADGDDESLNDAATAAEQTATQAEADALALSQTIPDSAVDDPEKKKAKLLRKRKFIDKDLKALGVDPDDEEDIDDDEDDDNQPLTRGEFKKMQQVEIRKTATQMAESIQDPLDRAAVIRELSSVVPSDDPAKDFQKAVAIANIDRNSKILEEIQRTPIVRATHTRTGSAPLREEVFTPTAHEKMFMDKGLLTKADVLKARAKAATQQQ